MFSIKVSRWRHGDEKLRTIGVLSCVCLKPWLVRARSLMDSTTHHGEQKRLSVVHREGFILELFAVDGFTSGSCGTRVIKLNTLNMVSDN